MPVGEWQDPIDYDPVGPTSGDLDSVLLNVRSAGVVQTYPGVGTPDPSAEGHWDAADAAARAAVPAVDGEVPVPLRWEGGSLQVMGRQSAGYTDIDAEDWRYEATYGSRLEAVRISGTPRVPYYPETLPAGAVGVEWETPFSTLIACTADLTVFGAYPDAVADDGTDPYAGTRQSDWTNYLGILDGVTWDLDADELTVPDWDDHAPLLTVTAEDLAVASIDHTAFGYTYRIATDNFDLMPYIQAGDTPDALDAVFLTAWAEGTFGTPSAGLTAGAVFDYDSGAAALLSPGSIPSASSIWFTYQSPRYRFLYAGTAPPCRLYPRADHLGVGSGRAYPPPNTHQASARRAGAHY